MGPKSAVGSNREEADRKEIVKLDNSNSSDPASSSDQSSQKFAFSNANNSSNPQEPKRDSDPNDPVDSGKKTFGFRKARTGRNGERR